MLNIIDIILILIIAFGIWSGWRKGFLLGITDLIAWLGSLFIAFYTYSSVAAWIAEYIKSLGIWLIPLAFFATYIIARIIIGILIRQLLKIISAEKFYNRPDKILGIIPGAFSGFVNAIIVAALLAAIPFSQKLSDLVKDSKVASALIAPAEMVETKFSAVFDKAFEKIRNDLTVEPGENQSVTLPFTVKHPEVRQDLEAKMLKLLNEERRKRGIGSLEMDTQLVRVARAHCRDMFARGYFSHYTPEGKNPFDRMRKAGVSFITAGENLAYAHTLLMAQKGLMHSPEHRANILNPAFHHVGIGILSGSIYGLMIAQEFKN